MVIVTTSPAQILPPPPVAGFEAYFTDQELVCALVPFHVIAELQCPPPTLAPAKAQGEQVSGSAWITENLYHCLLHPNTGFSRTCPGFTGSENLLAQGSGCAPSASIWDFCGNHLLHQRVPPPITPDSPSSPLRPAERCLETRGQRDGGDQRR